MSSMSQPIPTVEQVLAQCRASNGLCHWDTEGCRIYLPEAELRQALKAAYDPQMAAWPALVEIGRPLLPGQICVFDA